MRGRWPLWRRQVREQPFIVLGVKRQLFEHWDKQQHELVNVFNDLLSRNGIPFCTGLFGDSLVRGRERLLHAGAHALPCIKKASGGRSKDVQRKIDERFSFRRDDLVNPSEQMERIEYQERTIDLQEEKIQKQLKT